MEHQKPKPDEKPIDDLVNGDAETDILSHDDVMPQRHGWSARETLSPKKGKKPTP
jgi:hypothetical protein